LVNLSDILIIPQSNQASPLEIEIKIGSCAKYEIESSSRSFRDDNLTEVTGLLAKIQTSTVYLLKKGKIHNL
jgi:hypothetical protein